MIRKNDTRVCARTGTARVERGDHQARRSRPDMQDVANEVPGCVGRLSVYVRDGRFELDRLLPIDVQLGEPAVRHVDGGADRALFLDADLLAPLLARRFRVVSIDARGHGDSAWLDAYFWTQDVADIVQVLRWLGHAHLLGHSYGGSLVTHAARYAAESIGKLVNIEGFGPPKKFLQPPGERERPSPGTPAALGDFMDARRRAHQRLDWRPYAELDDLVTRRQQQNPRLSSDWLRYFCWHGSRRDASGFRWKVDPLVGLGAGPWKPDWIKLGWQDVKTPMLALIAAEDDTWGPIENELLDERLGSAPHVERARVAKAGHFPHMEQPVETARLVLDYLTV